MKVEICQGQNCYDYGGKEIAQALKERGIDFEVSYCRSLCTYSPVVLLDDKLEMKMTVEGIMQRLDAAQP